MTKRSEIPPRLHELEALVMEQVWRRETATVRDVMDAINESAPKPRAYTTVMTIMDRLHLDFRGFRRRSELTVTGLA